MIEKHGYSPTEVDHASITPIARARARRGDFNADDFISLRNPGTDIAA
jgi:hypothetical protein